MEQRNIIYRVAVSGLHCRSSVELVNLKVAAIDGVKAASVGPDHVLTVLADAESVSPSDIVRTLIDSGMFPDGEVSTSSLATSETAETLTVAPEAIAPTEAATVAEPVDIEIEEVPTIDLPAPVTGACAVSSELEPAPVLLATVEAATPLDCAYEAIEESIKADIETPHVAVSPRASLVQRIKVDVSDDYYPSRIEVIPGVPVDIEFSEGHGCLARVVFEEFGIDQDLTDGGATVRLPGLTPGSHEFTCGMRMVHGTVVAAV